ncbi:hypothetical protein PG994_010540 [Apiospora phragmitis]|uniref:Uncharacterized protein n=1 Tax=Apiospora phragmitis TaxID=2905665 RepID=A0ABR1TQ82_9PEZI
MAPKATSSSKGDPGPSNPSTPKAVYVSVSVEPCNSEETRKYWAERAARAKAGLANPSALVNRASGEFDRGLVNAILAGKGELIATTVDDVRQDNNNSVSTLSGVSDVDGTVVYHNVSDSNASGDLTPTVPICKATEPFPLLPQSVSRRSVLRSSDPFVDKNTTTRASSQQTQYRLPRENNVGPYQPPASSSSPPPPALLTTATSSSAASLDQTSDLVITRIAPRRPSDVRQKRSASTLRSKFSSRGECNDGSPTTDDQDREIIVTDALRHVLYDGPCGHCETNHCACLTPDDDDAPGLPPMDATSNNKSRIVTEGFCRHCVLNRCSCITEDPRWGLHHASSTLHQAQQQQQKQKNTEQGGTSAQQSLRIISDTGTVRHYATGHDGSPSSSGGSSSSKGRRVTTTTTATMAAPTTAPTTPPPAYRAPFDRASSNNNNDHLADNNVHPPRRYRGATGAAASAPVTTMHPHVARPISVPLPLPRRRATGSDDTQPGDAVLLVPVCQRGGCSNHRRALVLHKPQQSPAND